LKTCVFSRLEVGGVFCFLWVTSASNNLVPD
jgi:hypothetical protein